MCESGAMIPAGSQLATLPQASLLRLSTLEKPGRAPGQHWAHVSPALVLVDTSHVICPPTAQGSARTHLVEASALGDLCATLHLAARLALGCGRHGRVWLQGVGARLMGWERDQRRKREAPVSNSVSWPAAELMRASCKTGRRTNKGWSVSAGPLQTAV